MSEPYCRKPFRVEDKGNSTAVGVWVQDADGEYIAMFGTVNVPEEENLQNALLFAAAPDLLTALQDALGWIDDDTTSFQMAKKAIAKANGK